MPKAKETRPEPSMAMIQRAAAFAARAHRHQLRKDKRTPYVSHPFRVAMTLRHAFGCEDESAIVAALLHDTIEDSQTDYDNLLEEFGREVADIIAALTKNTILEESEREADYDRRLAEADPRARLVKLADCYDNLSDLHDRTHKAQKKVLEKCERALKLVERDEKESTDTRAGAAALRALIGRARGISRRGMERRGRRGKEAQFVGERAVSAPARAAASRSRCSA